MILIKQFFHSIGTPILGYIVIVFAALVFQDAIFGRVTHESHISAIVIGGGLTALACVLAGYIIGRISPFAPMWHAAPLVVWLCVETTILHLRGGSPLWFDVMAGGSNAVGVALGCYLWVRLNESDVRETKS